MALHEAAFFFHGKNRLFEHTSQEEGSKFDG